MPITPPPPPLSPISLLKGFFGIYLPLCLTLAMVGGMHYYAFSNTQRAAREASEQLNVDLGRRTLSSDISAVVGDLMFLAEQLQTQELAHNTLLSVGDKQHLGELFASFSKHKGLYDQIRYLDSQGMELVRVNFNGGTPRILLDDELQNKRSRYYFNAALTLDAGGVYISPLDLNVEEEKIEYPLKPMIRFGTPVFDSAGTKQGVILLNYYGQRLIDNFKSAAANIIDHVQLVNAEGYWLSGPVPEDEWGFMFGQQSLFSGRYPQAWSSIVADQGGQIQTSEGMFTFATIYPAKIALASSKAPLTAVESIPLAQERNWKIISRVSSRELSATLPLFIQNHITLYLAMLALLTLSAGFLAVAQHRHRSSELQRDYEQRFRQTLENIELAAVALDDRGTVTFCNDYFLHLTGWKKSEVIQQHWVDHFVPLELREETRNILHQMRQPGQFPAHYESQVLTHTGKTRLLAWNNTLSYDATGKVIGVTGIGEDITDKRTTEDQLRKLSQAVEQSPSVVIITDRFGNIEYVNPKFTEISGFSYEEVVGKNPRVLKSGETGAKEYSDLWSTIMGGDTWRGIFHNKRKSGELYWEAAAISPIKSAAGEITHFLAVKEDITKHKSLEDQVEERNKELAKSQSLAAMGRMASMIAHDLRNPLSSVKMTLQIIGKHANSDSGQEEELRQIALEQIRYMEEILSDMLTFSRPDALKPEWLAIDKVIDMAITLTQRRLDELHVEVCKQYQAGLPTLYADPVKLRQVFSNLIANAAQATEGLFRPEIQIEAQVELGSSGTCLRMEISDNGCGIDEQERNKVFEPFFTTRAKGTGLGLAIVKRILDQHHASIEIQPNIPQGTRVILILPISPQQTQTHSEANA